MSSAAAPQGILSTATGNYQQPESHWLRASHVKPLLDDDPSLIWLEHFASTYGFEASHSEYDLSEFIFRKSREFEHAWLQNNCPGVERVCTEPYEVRSPAKVLKTFELMRQGVPVIAQAALWWAPERVYGAADLLVHTSWLTQRFPGLLSTTESTMPAPELGEIGKNGHYVVLDLKFKTKLEDSKNKIDRDIYAAQIRLYSYIVGHLQGLMPTSAFIITRDKVDLPHKFAVASKLNSGLDADLAKLRDHYADIVKNGTGYLPWRDAAVKYALGEGEKWSKAKRRMALDFFPGRDPQVVYNVSASLASHLASAGYPSLDSLLAVDPAILPIETCKGFGGSGAKARPIRAVLDANRNKKPIVPTPSAVPVSREFEFFIDFEYFTNINVDYGKQWPSLEGCEMIFMVGLGRHNAAGWEFVLFVAEEESHAAEADMLNRVITYLNATTGAAFINPARTALYHWSSAENWQCKRAADRHFPDPNHPLRNLPLVDLQRNFLATPCCYPGSFGFDLKDSGKALAKMFPELDPGWPGDLDEGSKAMVMGWTAYAKGGVQDSTELKSLAPYLEADCRAVHSILTWMRENALKSVGTTP